MTTQVVRLNAMVHSAMPISGQVQNSAIALTMPAFLHVRVTAICMKFAMATVMTTLMMRFRATSCVTIALGSGTAGRVQQFMLGAMI